MPGWQFMAPSRWHARDPHPAHRRLSRAWRYDPDGQHCANVTGCPRRAIAALHVKVAKPTACAVRRILAGDDGRGRRRREIHARREATRVHPIADGLAAAGARAAIPTRLSRSGCSHASWAADRRPRGNNSVRQLAIVGSRGPYPPMLVGVSGSHVHDHQIRQIDHATALGRLRLSPSAAPMPAGILGGLWRVPLLGVGFMAAMAARGAAWTGAHAGLGR